MASQVKIIYFLYHVIIPVVASLLTPLRLTLKQFLSRRLKNTGLYLLSINAFKELLIGAVRCGIKLFGFDLLVDGLLHDAQTPLVGDMVATVGVCITLKSY